MLCTPWPLHSGTSCAQSLGTLFAAVGSPVLKVLQVYPSFNHWLPLWSVGQGSWESVYACSRPFALLAIPLAIFSIFLKLGLKLLLCKLKPNRLIKKYSSGKIKKTSWRTENCLESSNCSISTSIYLENWNYIYLHWKIQVNLLLFECFNGPYVCECMLCILEARICVFIFVCSWGSECGR